MSSGPSLKILVVEDDAYIRATVEYLLIAVLKDAKVSQAVDGIDGLRQSREQQFDWIVTDILMPGMSGIDMLFQMRAEGVLSPAIIASASPLPSFDRARLEPFVYVAKPDLSPIARIIQAGSNQSATLTRPL